MAGTRDVYDSTDFTGNALKEGEYITVAVKEATRKYWYSNGHDVASEMYADFVDSGANDVTGKMRFVVYESSRLDDIKVKNGRRARGDTYDLGTLRAADANDRQTWDDLDEQAIGAAQDEVVAIQIKVDNATNDGNTIDTGASTFHTPRTEYQR